MSSGPSKDNYSEAEHQAWPGFVDILSSTVLVLAFALLVLVLVLSVTKITSSVGKESNEASPSSVKIETEVLGDYRAEFQKLAIISNPSLRQEMEIHREAPTVEKEDKNPIYVPEIGATVVDKPEKVKELGDSQRQVLGDIPKVVDAKSIEVLKELIIVQRDVIEQQRKVIEQQDKDITETVREYQSLLSLITKEKEVETIRQKIVPKDAQTKFLDTSSNAEKLSGSVDKPNGAGSLFLSPPNNPSAGVEVVDDGSSVRFNFKDNAPFLTKGSQAEVAKVINKNIDFYKNNSIVLETRVTSYAVSGAEAQRIAVERLLIFRSLLIEAGVSPSMIKLKTVDSDVMDNTGGAEGSASNITNKNSDELNYGWVAIKRND